MGLFSALFEIKVWGMVLVALSFLFVGILLLIDSAFNGTNNTINGVHEANHEVYRQAHDGVEQIRKWKPK
jgi:hypothetical protein